MKYQDIADQIYQMIRSGESWIYGCSTYVLDNTDPLTEGYKVNDIWA